MAPELPDWEREILEQLAKTPPKKVKGLLAWKAWSIVYHLGGPFLASPQIFALWENPMLTAHQSPWKGEQAGIYSWAKEENFRMDWGVIEGEFSVVGKVEVLGEFLFCKKPGERVTRGYRSLQAKVKELSFNLCPECGMLNQKRWVELFAVDFPAGLISSEGLPQEIIGYCRSCWETVADLFPAPPITWTAEQMQKVLEDRYQCPVLPAPPWVLNGQVVGKMGDKYLVVLG